MLNNLKIIYRYQNFINTYNKQIEALENDGISVFIPENII